MNIKEYISDLIISKQLPVCFMWDDDYHECNIEFYTGQNSTITVPKYLNGKSKVWTFPIWDNDKCDPTIYIRNIFKSNKPTIEECLTELLYWWELNKHKCTQIEYYEPI